MSHIWLLKDRDVDGSVCRWQQWRAWGQGSSRQRVLTPGWCLIRSWLYCTRWSLSPCSCHHSVAQSRNNLTKADKHSRKQTQSIFKIRITNMVSPSAEETVYNSDVRKCVIMWCGWAHPAFNWFIMLIQQDYVFHSENLLLPISLMMTVPFCLTPALPIWKQTTEIEEYTSSLWWKDYAR